MINKQATVEALIKQIDGGELTLPEFQRGFVWSRNKVKNLVDSLYRKYPVGSLLMWKAEREHVSYRGESAVKKEEVELLLDGQQRLTSLYGVIKGKEPPFFHGALKGFKDLYFNVETEEFAFYSPTKVAGKSWVSVTELMQPGGSRRFWEQLSGSLDDKAEAEYDRRLEMLREIRSRNFHIDVVDKSVTVDEVVEIFTRVNSKGVNLSKGDLSLARICATWPECRHYMDDAIRTWKSGGFNIDQDLLLRIVTVVLTGAPDFSKLHSMRRGEIEKGFEQAVKYTEKILGIIADNLGLDHDRVLFNKNALPVVGKWLHLRNGKARSDQEQRQLLKWYLQSGILGRYTGSTLSTMSQDLKALDSQGVDGLTGQLRATYGDDLSVRPSQFSGSTVKARLYPVLYALTHNFGGVDFGTGKQLGFEQDATARSYCRIFSARVLRDHGIAAKEGNAIANYCFLTKRTIDEIGTQAPSQYLARFSENALKSQWIPTDRELWKAERYDDFLEARRQILAKAANQFIAALKTSQLRLETPPRPHGKIESTEELEKLIALDDWVAAHKYMRGQLEWELKDEADKALAILDLAWPHGILGDEERGVAVLLDEELSTHDLAGAAGFRCFSNTESFQCYVDDNFNFVDHDVLTSSATTAELFRKFRQSVLGMDSSVTVEFLPKYITFQVNGKSFLDVTVELDMLRLFLHLSISEIDSHLERCIDVSGDTRNPTGGHTLVRLPSKVSSNSDAWSWVLGVVRQALRRQEEAPNVFRRHP